VNGEKLMEPKVGSFCWLELGTTDRVAAKSFYSNLFGWTGADMPMGPDMTYTILRLGSNDAGGAYQLTKDEIAAHVPPHWMLYIKVDNADQAAAKATSLGAKQIVPPTDIPNVGRFSLIQDPTGAHVAVFQPGQHRGLQNFGEIGSLCWADLNTSDSAKASKFYSAWLGWTFDEGDKDYSHIINGTGQENMIGGMPREMHGPPGTPSHWLSYFHVADCKASAAKAAQLGAKVMMPAELMKDVGTIAVLADPQGAVFALYQHLPR
jgi:predicted enzyme related to lactoylglutathione lyase